MGLECCALQEAMVKYHKRGKKMSCFAFKVSYMFASSVLPNYLILFLVLFCYTHAWFLVLY
jgi:hypothetical protein